MATPKHPLSITHAEFLQALVKAEDLSDQELIKQTRARSARSYFVRHQDRIRPFKAVLHLAYKLAGKDWGDGPQSASAARQLRASFDILHITDKTERKRLKRQREMAERWARPGQAAFRTALLELFGGKCAISGCYSLDAIDAAHIIGVDGEGEDKVSNGLILRADLHRLFDRDLMAINPKSGLVNFAPQCGRDYEDLDRVSVNFPIRGPKLAAFNARWRRFKAKGRTTG